MLDALLGSLESPTPIMVLSSADPTMFCSGMDIGVPDHERPGLSDGFYGLYEHMIMADTLLIAAIGGPAVGAGAQLAIASDIRILHPDAWLRFPGVGHGLAVGAWGLPSLIGRGRTLRACATMQRIDAATAEAWGLAAMIDPEPEAVAERLAASLTEHSAEALARKKRVAAAATGVEAALAQERADNRDTWTGSIAGLER